MENQHFMPKNPCFSTKKRFDAGFLRKRTIYYKTDYQLLPDFFCFNGFKS